MREFVVSEAPLGRVAALARATVEDIGGVVAHHTDRITEFDHLQTDEDDWSRSGYVGTFQRYREDPVRIRIRTWASWPRRLFLWTVWLGLVEAVIFFTLSFVQIPPSPNVWIFTAIPTFTLLAVFLLLYATSWADSADLEDHIARKLTSRIVDDEQIPGDLYTIGEWEEHRQDLIEAAVEDAERKAPERPSRAERALQTIAPSGASSSGGLIQRFRSEEDDEAAPEPAEQTAGPATDDEDVPAEGEVTEDQAAGDEDAGEADAGFVDKLAFWRSADAEADEERPAEEADEDVDPEVQAKRDRLEELKRQREAKQTDASDEGLLDKVAFWRSGPESQDTEEDEGPQPSEP